MPPVTYAQLRDSGWTRRAIVNALDRGSLRRLSRGWYELGSCSADEVSAAGSGTRLGCLTGLRDHGVWVPPTPHPHLIVPRWADPVASGVLHVLPRKSPWPLGAVRYGVVDCLRQAIRFHDVETALIVPESASNLRLYRRPPRAA